MRTLLLVFLVMMATCVVASAWTTPELISGGLGGLYASVAAGQTGIHAAINPVHLPYGDVYYRVCRNGNWSSLVKVSADSRLSYDPEIAVDAQERAYIVWIDWTSSARPQLWYSVLVDPDHPETWRQPQLLRDFTSYVGIDCGGRFLRLVYTDYLSDDLFYSEQDLSVTDTSGGIRLQEERIPFDDGTGWPDVSGTRVVFMDRRWPYQIYYTEHLFDSTWTAPVNLSDSPGESSFPRIDGDWVVWEEAYRGTMTIWQYHLGADGKVRVTDGVTPVVTSLSDGLPGIAFARYANNLPDGVYFQSATAVVDTVTPNGLYPEIDRRGDTLYMVWGSSEGAYYASQVGWRVGIYNEGEDVNSPVKSGLKLLPNPSWGEVTVEFQLPQATEVILSVYNVNGQLVMHRQLLGMPGRNRQNLFMRGGEAAGLYFLRVEFSNGLPAKVAKLVLLR